MAIYMLDFEIKENYSLKQLNRIRTGGRSLYYAIANNVSDLKRIIFFSREQKLPFYILGNGSNILISDEDFAGIVIKLSGDFESISFNKNDNAFTAGAGASLMELGNELAKHGYLAFSYMAVIPGTVGGAVRMNAGTHKEGEIKDRFIKALVMDPKTDEISEYSKNSMEFAYRESAISKSLKIIIQATFQLPQQKETTSQEAQMFVRDLLASRCSKQPKNLKNFGSTFKRPFGGSSAGWYLDRVGMKGMRIGDAMVAEEHANWILNEDNAKSQDVKKLIEIGQKRVFEEFGVQLEREVVYLPEDIKEWT